MFSPRYCIGVVVDPEFGERLRELATLMHVWIADTPKNQAVAEQLWTEKQTRTPESGVTTFHVNAALSPETWTVEILDTIQEHHGWNSQSPPIDAIEIHGTALTDELREALTVRGFSRIDQFGDALLACMPAAE